VAPQPLHLGWGVGKKELYYWNISSTLRTGTWGKRHRSGDGGAMKSKSSPTGKLKTLNGRRSI